jgi:hypothetical protein
LVTFCLWSTVHWAAGCASTHMSFDQRQCQQDQAGQAARSLCCRRANKTQNHDNVRELTIHGAAKRPSATSVTSPPLCWAKGCRETRTAPRLDEPIEPCAVRGFLTSPIDVSDGMVWPCSAAHKSGNGWEALARAQGICDAHQSNYDGSRFDYKHRHW